MAQTTDGKKRVYVREYTTSKGVTVPTHYRTPPCACPPPPPRPRR